jgi:hypothetical protein
MCSLYPHEIWKYRIARFKGPKSGFLKPYTIYQFSEVIRDDPTKCGPEGLLFKKKVLSPLVNLFNKDEDL